MPRIAWLRWMLAAALALAVHVALFAALGQRGLRIASGAAPEIPVIELDEATAGESAGPAPSEAEPPSRGLPDDKASTATAEARPDVQKVEQPTPQPPRARVDPPAPTPQPTIAVEPAKTARRPARRPVGKEPQHMKSVIVRPRAGAAASAAAAPAPGSSLSVGDWNSLVSAQIRRNQHYPDSARSRGEEGVATIAFSVARSGAIGAARLAASSGYPDLDAEALAAVRRSNPLPPPPGALGAPVARNVPIRFGLR